MATDPTTGDIYVADELNRRMQRFTAWGEFLGAWGSQGAGAGEFNGPQGVAVDSAGNVYVFDRENRRIQKFTPAGQFLLMFGGEVDKTTHANVCTEADIEGGDTCGAGVEGTADGFFGTLALGSYIAVGPGDKIYVGDQERIQVFDTSGAFIESIPLPGEFVQSLAVDTDVFSPSYGDLYVTYNAILLPSHVLAPNHAKENVRRMSPTGAPLGTLEVENPRALATNPSNGDVYVMNQIFVDQGAVIAFDANGKQIESINGNDFYESTGLGVNAPETCGLEGTDLIVASTEQANSFVRIYGSPPDPTKCPPEKVPPSVVDQFASSVNSLSATVKARINPHFWTETTRYFVEYGTGKCSEEGCTSKQPAPPGAPLVGPVTNSDITTSGILLAGLAPDTAYHYRFVAKSDGSPLSIAGAEASLHTLPLPGEPGPDNCPNAVLRTGASAHLPDCRAYEMVSPVDKNGGDVLTNAHENYKQAASELAVTDESGNRMTFSSFRAFAGAEGAPFADQYIAERGADGWTTRAIAAARNSVSFYPSGGTGNATSYKLFSEDLCSGWLLQDTAVALVPGAPSETGTLYRRGLCGGGYEVSSSVAPPHFGLAPLESTYYPEVQGVSADGATTVFRANDALTPEACPTAGIFQVYETLGGGRLRLVSVKPSESNMAGQPSCEQSSTGTAQGNPGEFREDSTAGAVSADAERIYWTTGRTIYLRDNAREEESKHNAAGKCTQGTKACTYEVSGLVSNEQARFLAGSSDGARAYFSIGLSGAERLYEFEATEEKNGLATTKVLIAKGFKGFMGASTDARRAYFVSTEELAAGATAGKNNLYFYEKGAGPRFVAELSDLDVFGTAAALTLPTPVSALPVQRTSRVSPDGLHAAFLSTASLTGFDNIDAQSGEPDAEAFVYDAAAEGGRGKLVCASCNATGTRPSGRQVEESPGNNQIKLWAAAIIPGWPMQTRGSRALSDDGKRLFFTSFEALVPRDTNGKADVYEWEASSGRGECLGAQGGELFVPESSGCISLISSGRSPTDSEFLDATPSGDDVFFATLSSLVRQDTGLVDVYDARVDGGFPEPLAAPAACEGEACQGPTSSPAGQVPGSGSYVGPGNLRQPKPKGCPKGKVKKQGKCVKKKTKKKSKNHHKKHKTKKSGRTGR
ncbi:MAG TPA: hypothetical protein VMF55_15930 [Solirubrobacterales bacterium]|nr:hypothetical protein [Solirubrobacterales bacterium]